jgi:hypothetical protein
MGIDPGKNGGISVVDREQVRMTNLMPETTADIWHTIDTMNKMFKIEFACIELVNAWKGEAAKSSFTFGRNFGELKMALFASRIPYTEVVPVKWMRSFSIAPKKKKETQYAFKDRHRSKAQQLYPNLNIWDCTLSMQRAVCDSILIARYAMQETERLYA